MSARNGFQRRLWVFLAAFGTFLSGYAQTGPCDFRMSERIAGVAALIASGETGIAAPAIRSLEEEVQRACPDDSSACSDLSYLKGTLFLLADEPDSALACFRDARRYAVTLFQLSRIDQNTGAVYFAGSGYGKAIRYFSHALSEMEASGSRSPRRVLQLCDNLGSACFENGDFTEAYEWWRQSQDVAEALFPYDSLLLSGILNKMALVQGSLGNWEGAADLFGRALRIQETDTGGPGPAEAMILKNLAIARLRSGDKEGASAALSLLESRSRTDLPGDPLSRAGVLGIKAWIAFAEKDLSRAGVLLDEALGMISGGMRTRSGNGAELTAFRLLRDRASMHYLQTGRESSATPEIIHEIYRMQKEAFSALNRIRGADGTLPAFLLIHDSVEVLARRTLETGILLSQDHPGPARELLSMAELLRLRPRRPDAVLNRDGDDTLADSLTGEWLRLNRKILQAEIRNLRARDYNGSGDHESEHLLFRLRNELDSLSAVMTVRGMPACFAVPGPAPDEWPLPALKSGEAVLDYFLLSGKLFLFIVRDDTVHFVWRDPDPGFETSAKDLLRSLRTADDRLFRKVSPAVSEVLVKPALPLLQGIRRLYVVPDPSFRGIPVECLTGGDLNGGPEFLAQRYAISYHASLQDVIPDPLRVALPGCLVFAPGAGSGGSLEELREAVTEMREVTGLFRSHGLPAEMFSGGDADESALLRALPSNRIIHIATHARNDETDPGGPGLHLWKRPPPGSGDELINGIFELKEISSVRLKCDLLTLSCCTLDDGGEAGEASGRVHEAFLDAGARRVLSSLWDVSDRHTRTLMSNFYRFLLDGDSYAEALRKAKVKMLQNPETASAYLWAPFILSAN